MSSEEKIEETSVEVTKMKEAELPETKEEKTVNGNGEEEKIEEQDTKTEAKQETEKMEVDHVSSSTPNDVTADDADEKVTKDEDVKEEEDVTEDTTKEGDDEDEDSSSDESLPPGLLERPVEILEDKRQRKKTIRLTYDESPTPTPDKKKFAVPEGKGVKLSQHPRVEWQLDQNKADDLKIIHKLFYGVFGQAYTCKKNIRQFSGFEFEKGSKEYEKKEAYIGKFTLDNLRWSMKVLDVERKGNKDDMIASLLEWCLSPHPSGLTVPQKKKKKRKSESATPKPKKPRKSSTAASKTPTSAVELSSDSELSDTEKPPPPAKKAPATPKSPKKKTSTPKKKVDSATKVKITKGLVKKNTSMDSDDDIPLKKTKKKPPTNTEIRKAVEQILKGADLEQITMKTVCIKVYARFPDFDISDRKPFIKETVKKVIS